MSDSLLSRMTNNGRERPFSFGIGVCSGPRTDSWSWSWNLPSGRNQVNNTCTAIDNACVTGLGTFHHGRNLPLPVHARRKKTVTRLTHQVRGSCHMAGSMPLPCQPIPCRWSFFVKSQVSGVAERSKPSKFSHRTQREPITYNNN